MHVCVYWVNMKVGDLSERRRRNYPLRPPNVGVVTLLSFVDDNI